MAHAGGVFRQHRHRVATAKGAVAGVKQQVGVRAGRGHQRVDFLGAFHDGAHVVMVHQRHALTGQIGGESLQLSAKGHHFGSSQTGPVIHRLFRVAVDRVRGLADDADLAAIVLQLGQMVLNRLDLVLDRPHQQLGRIPARDELQPVRRQQGTQRLGVVGPAVAVLDAVKADLAARLVKDAGGRDVGADRLVVIIGPGDGVGSKLDHLGCLSCPATGGRCSCRNSRARRSPRVGRKPPARPHPTRCRPRQCRGSGRCRSR